MGEVSDKKLHLKKMKMKIKAFQNKEKPNLFQKAAELNHMEVDEKKVKKSSGLKKRGREKETNIEPTESDLDNIKFDDEATGDNQIEKLSRKKKANKIIASKSEVEDKSDEANGDNQIEKLSRKRKAKKITASKSEGEEAIKLTNEVKGDFSGQNVSQSEENKTNKMRKKKRKDEKRKKDGENKANEFEGEGEDGVKEEDAKSKDARKRKKKIHVLSRKDENLLEEKAEPEQNDVYEMSSGDEDCSRGMKKWITEYHQSRPGIKVLQDQIDDFITAHEEQEEEARKEREAQAAEGGWTVVVHHKGRKKTTEAESGTAVGSVAPAAATENMLKKKTKQVGTDFYHFQKREAQMNERMTLLRKFEQDKKRIQEMKAARKFRPY